MKFIYSAPNLLFVSHCKNLLESHGVNCIIKNENLNSAAGEIPPTECWPELWLIKNEDYQRAAYILNSERQNQDSWICPSCHESLEEQFDKCWSCGDWKMG
ncbi:DUF2007 domain-containing protein [Candidatus Nitrosacidococcus sp. I8]|uniref:putative signal transducing protein n=1 Tax=Candidatus Nitrosacidococcus sp. I8 TaxID=2942908 RepID=UPI0022279AC5|nr:DUF2007 domain-containing protein [Candidatus Nitrosacidococcus sp. I8]CAH9019344.1 hypothetical protein NURINAE_01486 [Candidatus Nitrosacidococcus sp. I8]